MNTKRRVYTSAAVMVFALAFATGVRADPALAPPGNAQTWRTLHRTWEQRGGSSGYHIPGTEFELYFGQSHPFRLSSSEVRISGGHAQFYADGYWFTSFDPVPDRWQPDWYATDDVTILVMPDGYCLVDDQYPGDVIEVGVEQP